MNLIQTPCHPGCWVACTQGYPSGNTEHLKHWSFLKLFHRISWKKPQFRLRPWELQWCWGSHSPSLPVLCCSHGSARSCSLADPWTQCPSLTLVLSFLHGLFWPPWLNLVTGTGSSSTEGLLLLPELHLFLWISLSLLLLNPWIFWRITPKMLQQHQGAQCLRWKGSGAGKAPVWLPRAQTQCLPHESSCIWAGRAGSEGACGHGVRGFSDWGWSIQLGVFKSAGRWQVKSKVHKSPEAPSTHGVGQQKGDNNLLFSENLAYFSKHGSIGWSSTATVLL